MKVYKLSKQESNRITFMRAICIIMVIFLHQYSEEIELNDVAVEFGRYSFIGGFEYIVSRIITFSAVPLFYLISSILLYSKEFTWLSNMKKKVKTLILPYVVWISIYIFVYFIGQSLPQTKIFFVNSGRAVLDMSILDFLGAYFGFVGQGLFVNAFWFLKDLIILNVLAVVIKKIIDKFQGLCLLCIILLWMLGGTQLTIILNTQSICFFACGYYVVKYNKRMNTIDSIPLWEIIVSYFLLIFLEYRFYLLYNPLRIAAHAFTIIVGIMLIIRISGMICNSYATTCSKILRMVAQYSFFIYATQDLVQTILKKITTKIWNQDLIIQFVTYIFIPTLTCMSCVIIAMLLEKVSPSLYLILSGSREK